jgi:3-oxoacyl-[acyl-carrier protein] reductase
MDNLKDKVIIITGASKGIGRVTALKLSERSAKLVLVSRKIADLEKVESELTGFKDNIISLQADISKEEDCKKLVDVAIKKFGKIDVLINNAAQFNHDSITDLKMEDFDRVWMTNVRGVIVLIKLVLPFMMKQNNGTILNVSSTSGKRGYARGTAYAASKFALNGITECILREVRDYNIRMLTISPSMVDTKIKAKSEIKEGGKGVYMRVEDVADSIIFSLNLPQRALLKDLELWGTNP